MPTSNSIEININIKALNGLCPLLVFLFEQIIIFAETVGKKTQFTSPVYKYVAHIQVQIDRYSDK